MLHISVLQRGISALSLKFLPKMTLTNEFHKIYQLIKVFGLLAITSLHKSPFILESRSLMLVFSQADSAPTC